MQCIAKNLLKNAYNFQAKENDVFITSYPKTGTTLVQNICHLLRSNCDMNFDEISQVTPWTKVALDCGMDLNAEQQYKPRLYKSHEPYHHIAKGGKYIYIIRNPKSVLVSAYKFITDYCGFNQNQQDISLDDFTTHIFLALGTNSGTYVDHILSYLPVYNDPNVLFIFF